MCRYIIEGGKKIKGEIEVQGSKNAVLPILAATLINNGKSTINNCPSLRDVDVMLTIMEDLGCKITKSDGRIEIDSSNITGHEIPVEMAAEMRSSIIFLGPLLARMGKVTIAYPGGCEIGPRPIDLHLKALRNLGARIFDIQRGFLYAEADKLKGCEIQLDYPSVGATENAMIAATFAEGETIIRNAAKEPEIIDLQNFLIELGADIEGAGSGVIRIRGFKVNDKGTREVGFNRDIEYTIIPDRIVAGTYMVAAAITGGELLVKNVIPEHVSPVISLLRESGCKIQTNENSIYISGPSRPKCIELIRTLPYPGFPTDMQPQMVSLLTISKGTGIVVETVFESRYKHVNELIKMGANIKIEGRLAIIRGVKALKGADVTAWDLRGGAAMILAGLVAEGRTVVNDMKHIERGYEKIEEKLSGVGASIQKVIEVIK